MAWGVNLYLCGYVTGVYVSQTLPYKDGSNV